MCCMSEFTTMPEGIDPLHFVQRIRMDPQSLPFERYECLEGTWTPMMAMGEDHFYGTVRHTVYTPGPFSTTTQTLKTR